MSRILGLEPGLPSNILELLEGFLYAVPGQRKYAEIAFVPKENKLVAQKSDLQGNIATTPAGKVLAYAENIMRRPPEELAQYVITRR